MPANHGACHSSAKFYYHGERGIYPVTSYMELKEVDLTAIIEYLTTYSGFKFSLPGIRLIIIQTHRPFQTDGAKRQDHFRSFIHEGR
jgi:hypothetical protein